MKDLLKWFAFILVLMGLGVLIAYCNSLHPKPLLTTEQLEEAYDSDNYEQWQYRILTDEDIYSIYQKGVEEGKLDAEADYEEDKELLKNDTAYRAWLSGYEEGYQDALNGDPYDEGKADCYVP